MPLPELLLDARSDLGEGPIWHPDRGALSWVEIYDGRVNWLELDGSAGEVAGQTLDVLLAGDDADAKEKVASFAEAGGLRSRDVGPLKRARQLEQLGFLHITAQEPLGSEWGSAIKINW